MAGKARGCTHLGNTLISHGHVQLPKPTGEVVHFDGADNHTIKLTFPDWLFVFEKHFPTQDRMDSKLLHSRL
jgi:hypothetical protein